MFNRQTYISVRSNNSHNPVTCSRSMDDMGLPENKYDVEFLWIWFPFVTLTSARAVNKCMISETEEFGNTVTFFQLHWIFSFFKLNEILFMCYTVFFYELWHNLSWLREGITEKYYVTSWIIHGKETLNSPFKRRVTTLGDNTTACKKKKGGVGAGGMLQTDM